MWALQYCSLWMLDELTGCGEQRREMLKRSEYLNVCLNSTHPRRETWRRQWHPTLAWKIPWTKEPGRLQSTGSLRVGYDWATSLSLFTFIHWRRKWQPTPVFLPGESQGRGSLVGCHLWYRTELDMNEVTLAAAAAARRETWINSSRCKMQEHRVEKQGVPTF